MAANPSIQLGTDGNWAIKEDNLLAYKKDGTRFFNKEFDFTRGSLATFVDKDSLIKYSGVTDTELVVNGNFATDSDWVKQTGWSISDGKAVSNGSNAYLIQSSIVSSSVNKIFKISFTVSDYVSGSWNVGVGGYDFYQTSSFSDGDYTVYAKVLNVSANNNFYFRGFNLYASIDNVSVKEIQTDVPRIDFTDDTTGHLLLEPQSTNLVPYSQKITEFSQTNATLFDNQTISPDGTQNAGGATKLGVNANDRIRETISVSNSTVYNISAFVKNSTIAVGGVTTIGFRVSGGTLFRKGYEWGASGLSFSSSQDSGTRTNEILQDYGNGWYRIGFSFTTNGTSGIFEIDLDRQNGSDTTTLFIWGAQLEEQSYVTSYIPTNGSTATRNAEVCNNSGSAQDFNSEEGVLYAEIAALADDLTFRQISISDGTNDNRVRINYTSTSQQIQSRVVVSGVNQASINKSNFTDITDLTKIALSYKQNEVKFYINGELIGTDTSATMPTADTFNVLNFDSGSGTGDFYGKTKNLKVFKRAMSDEELQQLTT